MVVVVLVLVTIGGLAALFYPRIQYGPKVEAPKWAAGIREDRLTSEYCISCHKEAGDHWHNSHHHLANREIKSENPAADYAGQSIETFSSQYVFDRAEDGSLRIVDTRKDPAIFERKPTMAIGHTPLVQPLIETDPGRFQVIDAAWDPHHAEWFATLGDEERNPGEWGHWTGQSMNWNSMCARCHMTAYHEGYDFPTDRFKSTWVEQGISCVQCHGPMTGHEKGGEALAAVDNFARDPQRMMETCAVCHSRGEDLTASFPPGEKFNDHIRLQLMTNPAYYHPDGQILDEVFVWGSFRHSRMGNAGVTCMDCHNPHTAELKMPFENNAVCMQCHVPGGRLNAPPIDPVAHSFHQPESMGNRCVECHMVETTYMQRDPRRDHGFIIPDPVLSKELGLPNACNRCHEEQTVEWAVEAWERWYGDEEKHAPRRGRTRAVAKAFAGDESVVPELLRLLEEEPVPAWKASLLELAGNLAPGNPTLDAVANELARHADPLIRAAAVRALEPNAGSRDTVRAALKDPTRLVRLDAEWNLSTELEPGSESRAELDTYLTLSLEHPVNRFRWGQDLFRRGLHHEGIEFAKRAIELDPLSPQLPEGLAFMYNATGQPRDAAREFEKAASLSAESDALPYYAALAWAEAGQLGRAENMLRESLRRNPQNGRVLYNLGLLQSQTGRSDESVRTLREAERADPTDPGIPYALATILIRQNLRDEAIAAANRALAIEPDYGPAVEFLRLVEASEQ